LGCSYRQVALAPAPGPPALPILTLARFCQPTSLVRHRDRSAK
jgi:hypothetical protein